MTHLLLLFTQQITVTALKALTIKLQNEYLDANEHDLNLNWFKIDLNGSRTHEKHTHKTKHTGQNARQQRSSNDATEPIDNSIKSDLVGDFVATSLV